MLLYFLFKSKRDESQTGLFGYYSLIDWWETRFTEKEKAKFKEVYENNSMPIPFEDLFNGPERPLMEDRHRKKSAVGFLSLLLNILAATKGCDDISQKFIDKCSQLIDTKTEELDLYFFYSSQIKLYGRLKQSNPSYELPFIQACQQQVHIL